MVLCTYPDFASAKNCAYTLVEKQLAACVNILPVMTSIYAWQGEIETAQEHLIVIKAHKNHYIAIESWLKENHPYVVPEIIALPIAQGFPDYLTWISQCHATS